MTDIRSAVTEIMRIVDQPTAIPTPDRLQELSRNYARYCEIINERLDQCIAWIATGDNNEAVRRAKALSILDEFNLLNFSKREEWKSLCLNYNLHIPPSLGTEQASQLYFAFDTVVLGEKFLEQHRQLALESAPIAKRISVLRNLRQLEPQNIVWTTMLGELEPIRLEEIDKALSTISPTYDSLKAITALQRELFETHWQSPPSSVLVSKCKQLVQAVSRDKSHKEMLQLANRIIEAFGEMDENKGKQTAAGWQRYLELHQIPREAIPASLTEKLVAPLAWVAELRKRENYKREYELRKRELETAMKSTDLAAINAAYTTVSLVAGNASETIPGTLAGTYRTVVKRLELQQRRHTRNVAVVSIAFCLTAIVIIGWLMHRSQQSNQYRTQAEYIAQELDLFEGKDPEKKADDALMGRLEKYITNLQETSPESFRFPAVNEQFARYNSIADNEKQRVTEFAGLRKTMSETVEAKGTNSIVLNRLERIARTDSEKMAVLEIKKRHLPLENQKQGDRDKQYRDLLTELLDKEEKIPELMKQSPTMAGRSIAEIEEGLIRLDRISNEVSPAYIMQKETLKKKIDIISKQVQQERNISLNYDMLFDQIGKYDQYKTVLEQLAQNDSGDQTNLQAQKTLTQIPTLELILAWNQFCREHLFSQEKIENDAATAESFLSQVDQLAPKMTFITAFSRIEEYLTQNRAFLQSGGRQANVKKIQEALKHFTKEQWESDNTSTKQPYVLLAQSIDTACQSLQASKETDKWIKSISDAISSPIPLEESQLDPGAETANFDPIIKTIMLYDLLAILIKDPIFAPSLTKWYNLIEESIDFDKTAEGYKSNEPVSKQHKVATGLLKELAQTSAAGVLTELRTDFNDHRKSLAGAAIEYRWVGMIDSKEGKVICRFNPNRMIPSGDLWTSAFSTVTTKPELIRIGNYNNGDVTFATLPELARGMPVYIAVNPPGP